MVSASIGPATAMVEAAAASVGARMILGGFVSGGIGVLRRWSRLDREARVLSDGYAGGLAGLIAVAIDLIVRYAL